MYVTLNTTFSVAPGQGKLVGQEGNIAYHRISRLSNTKALELARNLKVVFRVEFDTKIGDPSNRPVQVPLR